MGFPDHPTVELPAVDEQLAALVAAVPLDLAGARAELLAAVSGGPARTGHLCVCSWTLSPDGTHALLVNHPRFGWMPPGGHLLAGEHVLDGAARELTEETGAVALHTRAMSAHATMIPAKAGQPEHMHYAVGVLCLVDPTVPLQGEFDQPARWWSLADPLPDSFFGDNHLLVEYAALLEV